MCIIILIEGIELGKTNLTLFNKNISRKEENYLNKNEMSYVLGIIFTDGTLCEFSRNRGKIVIELKEEDSDILYKIKNLLPCNSSIRTRIRNTNFAQNYTSVILSIYDLEFRNLMKEYGLVVGKKSDIINIPDEIIIEDFLRGIIDGDGSLGISKNNIPFISLITASEELKNDYLKFINQLTGLKKISNRNTRDNIFNISVMRENAQVIVKRLYYENCLCIKRKYERAIEVIKWKRPLDVIKINHSVNRWSKEEDKYLLSHSIDETINFTKRTRKAVIIRLCRLKKIK